MVLISGGLDSPTVLAYALDKGYEVYPVSFDYGQRHIRELQSSEDICNYYGVKLKKIKIDMTQIGGSALTDKIDVPAIIYNFHVETRGPSGYCFPYSAHAYYSKWFAMYLASKHKGGVPSSFPFIFIGANAIDYSGYPDCRPGFFNAMEKTLNLGSQCP